MPVSVEFLDTCRRAIEVLPELAAYRAAYAAFDGAADGDKISAWVLTYDNAQPGQSPAYQLRAAIRGVVNTLADATVGDLERQSAYRTLVSEYVPAVLRPTPLADDVAARQDLLTQVLLDGLGGIGSDGTN